MMQKVLATAGLVLATALPATSHAAGSAAPIFRIHQGAPDGPVLFATDGSETGTACLRHSGSRARLYFTFLDPQGIGYAGVDLRADTVRPTVSDSAEAVLWIAPGTREDRAYRYRYEPERQGYRQVYTMPITVDVLPGEGPLDVHVETKDPAGNLEVRDLKLPPEAVLCS